MIIFYSQFISGFSIIFKPIWALTFQGEAFKWTDKCANVFEHFKLALMFESILKLPCRERLFVININASTTGVGVALTQQYDDVLMLMWYTSQMLSVHKRRYLTTKQESPTVVWDDNNFKSYIMGNLSVILTNNFALTSLQTKVNLEGKILCYAKQLLSYQYMIFSSPS